jgi:AraC-like DNA-binding protein
MNNVQMIRAVAQNEHSVTTPDALAVLAHELRNPIGAIRNACSLMESAGDLHGPVDHARRLIARQAGQLSVLVEGLLELPLLSPGALKLKPAWIDVVSEVEAAIESCTWVVNAARHDMRVEMPSRPLYAHVDGPRLRQAFTNLLDNACKYTRPPGRITVTLHWAARDFVFKVEDNGVGISKEVLPHVFDFSERSSRRPGEAARGLGIGLALVREIARLHGGDAEATSLGSGHGSTFVLRIPIGTETHPAHQTAALVPSVGTSPRHNKPAWPESWQSGLAGWQVRRALDFIKENIAEPISVADIASVARLSPSHFNRSFKRSVGLPVHLYVMRRRIELAQHLMVSTSDSLGAIATTCGMSDQSHLTRLFRRVLGQTPNAWRRARCSPAGVDPACHEGALK